MMVVYTYSEARQNFAALLDKAAQEGEVRVTRKDGQVFVIRPVESEGVIPRRKLGDPETGILC